MSDVPSGPLAETLTETLTELLGEPSAEAPSKAGAMPMPPSSGVQAPADASDEPTARGATVPMPMTKRSANLEANPAADASGEPMGPSPKPPLYYLSGSLTSALMAWLCLLFSQRVVIHFSLHPPHYSARIAQSIATALKTLIVGMGFLSTFSCAFVALGLFLVFIRSLSRAEAPGAS